MTQTPAPGVYEVRFNPNRDEIDIHIKETF